MKNIVFLQCDSMDGRAINCMGHPAMKRATKNIDKLAENGIVFENTYCNSPLCCPSRASMWSGKQIFNCEAWNNYKGLSTEDNIFTDELKKAGYEIGVFGKTDYLSGNHTERSWVSSWAGEPNTLIERPNFNEDFHPTIIQGDVKEVHKLHWDYISDGISWLSEHKDNKKPFFLYVGINTPHPKFITSQRYVDLIDKEFVNIPPHDIEKHPVIEYQRICKNWAFGYDEDIVKLTRTVYFAMIAEADAMVGELYSYLEKEKLIDDTYFVFTSDHGEMAMEHDLYYKNNMYEASVRVPLIISGADTLKGKRIKTCTSLVDIYPTLIDMAKIQQPDGLDGNSLMQELLTGEGTRDNVAFCEYHGENSNTSMYMVTNSNQKLVVYGHDYKPQFFDLKKDTHELNNLYGQGHPKQRELQDILDSFLNCKEVSEKVVRYNKESFAKWRRDNLSTGQYKDKMSRIFSGYDNVENVMPWRDKDEQIIIDWLGDFA